MPVIYWDISTKGMRMRHTVRVDGHAIASTLEPIYGSGKPYAIEDAQGEVIAHRYRWENARAIMHKLAVYRMRDIVERQIKRGE